MKPDTATMVGRIRRDRTIFRALAPTTGGLVTALRQWARENDVQVDAMEIAIRFRREHASNLADTQVQRLAMLLDGRFEDAYESGHRDGLIDGPEGVK